ncbi:MAG: Gfo/Idh/MocA family oxidoreductase [Clostridia bacterium]|nr:Gfo/Idh/MocA family oxidoreductase [Clostridia bacterium]
MNKKVKWGVLGYARIAKEHVIPAIMKSANSEFYAVASRDEEKLKSCREQFGCEKTYKSYEELLDDPEVDAVYIPLPNGLHKEWTIKAAQKGKHILCEKPIALNTDECLEMIRACEDNKVKLMEAFMYRYTKRTQKVWEILESGMIGDIKYINSSFRFHLTRYPDVRLEPGLGGGSLYDVGCYPINFIGMVTGQTPSSMSAECVLNNGVDVIFSAVLKYDSGIIATINCGFNAFLRVFSEVVGTKGVMEIPDTFFDNAGIITVNTAEGKKEIEVEASERYVLEVEDFADAVLHDRKPLFSLDETVRNMKIIDSLLEMVHKKG